MAFFGPFPPWGINKSHNTLHPLLLLLSPFKGERRKEGVGDPLGGAGGGAIPKKSILGFNVTNLKAIFLLGGAP